MDSIETIMEGIKTATNKYQPVLPTPEGLPSETDTLDLQELITPEGSDNIAFIPEAKNMQFKVLAWYEAVSNKAGAKIIASCLLESGDVFSVSRAIGDPLE